MRVRLAPMPIAWLLALVLLSSAGLAISGVLYTNHVAAQSERRDRLAREEAERKSLERDQQFCGLISLWDDAYLQNQPSTELGRKMAVELHAYRLALGCP